MTLADVDRFAMSLPGVTVSTKWGHRTWMVGDRGFAWQRPFSKADLKRFGDQAPPQGPILAARVEDLGEKVGETVHFARLDGSDIVYLATRESRHYLRPFSRVGRRLPAYVTSLGKAILAERPDPEVEKLLPPEMPALTERTLDRPGLLADLAGVRERGYAIDNEEGTVGLRCFGMALRYDTPVLDAISCSVPIARLTPAAEKSVLDALAEARSAIERAVRSAAW